MIGCLRFLDHFIRQLAVPLSDVHSRKAASALTAIANEKQRIARDTKKGGKGKVKPTLGGGGVAAAGAALKGGRGAMADLGVYDQALDDEFDDDFVCSYLLFLRPTYPDRVCRERRC